MTDASDDMREIYGAGLVKYVYTAQGHYAMVFRLPDGFHTWTEAACPSIIYFANGLVLPPTRDRSLEDCLGEIAEVQKAGSHSFLVASYDMTMVRARNAW